MIFKYTLHIYNLLKNIFLPIPYGIPKCLVRNFLCKVSSVQCSICGEKCAAKVCIVLCTL